MRVRVGGKNDERALSAAQSTRLPVHAACNCIWIYSFRPSDAEFAARHHDTDRQFRVGPKSAVFCQVQFADLPPGYDVINQTYPGWCTTFNEALQVLPTGSGSPIWSENDAVHPSMSACMTRTFMRSIPTANRSGSWQSEPTCTLRRRLAEIASSMSAAERQKIYLRSSERKFRFISNSTVLKLAPPQAESR